MSNTRGWLVLAVVCVAVFATTLDGLSVNIAPPSLATELGATNRQLQRIVDAHLLVFTGALLGAGGLGDRFGRRRTLIIGLALFGTCGTSEGLILARALMGIGVAVGPITPGWLLEPFWWVSPLQAPSSRSATSSPAPHGPNQMRQSDTVTQFRRTCRGPDHQDRSWSDDSYRKCGHVGGAREDGREEGGGPAAGVGRCGFG